MSVVAVIVTFNPDLPTLAALLDALGGQVDGVIVVDNGSDADLPAVIAARGVAGEEVVVLGDNLGLAAAQNHGIAIARERSCRYVVLFDQDSLPAAGTVDRLHRAAEARLQGGERVAAIGPGVVYASLDRPPTPVPAGKVAPDGLVETDHVMASGCLLPMAALDRVGAMRADLFMDCIDIEWCLRARAAGLRCYVAVEARMSHAFGAPVAILGRRFVWRTPLRHYYYFRNTVWLLRQGWIPAGWRFREGGRMLRRLGVCLLLLSPRRAQWRMTWRGIRDGLAGRLGKGPG